MAQFGVENRAAKSRGLEALERTGLVTVERQVGRNPLVTIVRKAPDSDRAAA